jgi:hypothetical protein
VVVEAEVGVAAEEKPPELEMAAAEVKGSARGPRLYLG